MESLFKDVRHAVRRLGRTPTFTLGALALMTLAIGATTAVFALVDQLLLKPPPFAEHERVVRVYQDSDEGDPSSSSYPAYLDMAATEGVFTSVAATTPATVQMEVGDVTEALAIEFTTSSYLETVGLAPAEGRWFDADMDQVGAGNFAVVSHRAWRTRFGSAPDMVGRTLRLNGQPTLVVGIGPEGFNGALGLVTDAWLSISSVAVGGSYRVTNLERREDHWYQVLARLADGVSIEQAQTAMTALSTRLAEAFPELNRGRDITVFAAADVRMHPQGDGELRRIGTLLMAVVLLVLLLATSNLGGLLLTRAVARSPEVAVRRALGASQARVARLLLVEAVLLTCAGGFAGLGFAAWLLSLLPTTDFAGALPGSVAAPLDLRVLLFSLLLMAGTGLFFGGIPALQVRRGDLAHAFRSGRSGANTGRSRFRDALITVQVAVSLVLVVGAGVMVRSLSSYARTDPGVDAERLAFLSTDFARAGIGDSARAAALLDLTERFTALPGIESVAFANALPVRGGPSTTTVVEGYQPAAGTGSVELPFVLVSPSYFTTLGIAVREGRVYTTEDVGAGAPIVVVNQAAADRFWPGQSALGRRLRPQGSPDAWRRVIGVVANAKVASMSEPATPQIYYVLGEAGLNTPYVFARTSGAPEAALGVLRSGLRELNPALPVLALSTMEEHVGASLQGSRMTASALGAFSLLAILLACIGVYGVVSVAVASRRAEIGIRMALGAARGRVVGMMMRQTALTVGLGLLLGGVLVIVAAGRIQPLLFGVRILSAGTLLPALSVLLVAVGLASWLPARGAARVDPSEALRAQ